ncbi:hypothetical protein INT44_007278 [Umbelopsis vinacea]|uniref:C2H2-type domain-containing protein n=1 Tax=Umbelopsis vinacea TaxID=44442 RepID=A0A8H7PNF7_9FUNG|nr:hypothetical protein INT44_007278 [Umbelopsis vinacea]
MEKPSLPSIKYILGDADPLIDHRPLPPPPQQTHIPAYNLFDRQLPPTPPALEHSRRHTHHRHSRSVSSMLDFQSLTLAPPTESPELPPFFANTGRISPPSFQSSPYLSPNTMSSSYNPRGSHTRSLSEFSHPYPQPNRSPPPRDHTHQRALGHRRAVSANTVDSMLNPKPYSLAPRPSLATDSPSFSSTSSPTDPFDDLDSEEDSRSSSPPTSSSTSNNRYVCPYCSKGFSRPSSLRIHTYSHTGEKPFVCSEDGCGRRFSVQSNMRRHLRVHKLGRQVKKTNNASPQPASE